MKRVALALMMTASPAAAQECFSTPDLHDGIAARDMRRVFSGLDADGSRVTEIFISPGGEWIAIISNASGLSCIAAGGPIGLVYVPAIGDPS